MGAMCEYLLYERPMTPNEGGYLSNSKAPSFVKPKFDYLGTNIYFTKLHQHTVNVTTKSKKQGKECERMDSARGP